jgi:hypothetical protein
MKPKPKARQPTRKPRVQWSKIANAVSDVLVVGLYLLARDSIGQNPDDQLAAFRGALEALAFVQALYSGNSVSEKYFTGKYHLFSTSTEDDETDSCG